MSKLPIRRLGLPLLGAVAFAVTLAVLHAGRPVADPRLVPAPPPLPSGDMADAGGSPPAASAVAADSGPAVPLSVAETETLIEQANGTDVQLRAAAIEALSRAPRAQALPVLQHIVKDGEASVDRHIALSALHELAMRQGDADGAIGELLRELVYDGNDEAVSENASAALQSLELPRTAALRPVRTSR